MQSFNKNSDIESLSFKGCKKSGKAGYLDAEIKNKYVTITPTQYCKHLHKAEISLSGGLPFL